MSQATIEVRPPVWPQSVVPAEKKNESTGARLKAMREAAGYTQDDAAAKVGIKPITLSRYERGVVAAMDAETLKALGELYGRTVDEILGSDRPSPVEREAKRSPYPEIEALIADELAAGRAISAAHLAELRGLRYRVHTTLALYEEAAGTLAKLRAAERGKSLPKRRVPKG